MKKILQIALLIQFCSTSLLAQPVFQKTYGGWASDWGHCVQQTSDGGIIIAGATNSFTVSWYSDLYLIKTDEDGNLVWSKSYGGDEGNETARAVLQTDDGGYLVAGGTFSFGAGGEDVYLLRTDAEGDTVWTRTFGGTHNDRAEAMIATDDGGFVVTGYTGGGTGNSNYDILLLKFNMDGNMLWTKKYGGPEDDFGTSVRQTNDGGYSISGHGLGFGSGNWEVYLIKTDENGTVLWSKTYGDIHADYSSDVLLTDDGGYLLAGNYGGSTIVNANAFLAKTDSLGNFEWSKLYECGSEAVQKNADGGWVIAGARNGDACLLKVDENGVVIWARAYGGDGDDNFKSVIQLDNGGYLMAGSFKSYPINYYGNVYLVQTNSDGNSNCFETELFHLVLYETLNVSAFSLSTGQPAWTPGTTATQIHDDGSETELCFSTSVDEQEKPKSAFTLMPNPFDSETTLHSNTYLKNGTLTVYNSMGLEIQQLTNISGNAIPLTFSDLAPGIYYLRLDDGQNTFTIKKVVIN